MKPNRFTRAQLAREEHPITRREKQTNDDVNDWQQDEQLWTCPTCHGFGDGEQPRTLCPTCFGYGKVRKDSK